MKTFLELVKIKHWIKNIFIFAPLVFSLQLLQVEKIINEIVAFFSFICISVFVYIINDLIDAGNDAKHPVKSLRPIASGRINKKIGFSIGFVFFVIGLFLSFFLKFNATIIVLSYLVMNILYSFFLKKVIILDVFVIAIGFCLRVLIGSIAIDVPLSNWMLLTTFSISLIFGFSKRRHEILVLGVNFHHHRERLKDYNKEFLDIMICISMAITIISYAIWAMDPAVIDKIHSENLLLTLPFVLFGLFRYLMLIYSREKGGNPEELVATDPGIIISVVLYLVTVFILVYFKDFFNNQYFDFKLFSYLIKL